MKHINHHPRLASLIVFVLGLLTLLPCAHAETSLRPARLMLGFYFQSITEMASRSDIEVSLNFWAKDLLAEEASKVNIHFTESRAILFDNMEDMHNAMLRGELDMVVGPPLLLARYFKRNELSDGFTGLLDGGRPDNLLLIARNDKNIQSVKDLQGKKLLMLADDEMADVFLDTLFLKQFSKGYKNIASAVEQQKKASRIVLDIYFKKSDAGIVYRNAYDVMVELNPDIANNIVILDKYPIRSRNFSYFVAGYPFAADLANMAISIFKNNPRAQQILDVFKTPELANCAVKELDEFDKFYAGYLKLNRHEKP